MYLCESICEHEYLEIPPPTTPLHPTTTFTSPVELCLSFSFFFFLHFQGLKMRPRVASLLLRRMGGVCTPVTRQPVLSTLCWSTRSTTGTVELEKRPRWGPGDSTGGWIWVRTERKRETIGRGSVLQCRSEDWRHARMSKIVKKWVRGDKRNREKEKTRAQLVRSPYWINHDGLQVLWTDWIRETNLITAHSLMNVSPLPLSHTSFFTINNKLPGQIWKEQNKHRQPHKITKRSISPETNRCASSTAFSETALALATW